jgi:hypothetical protein
MFKPVNVFRKESKPTHSYEKIKDGDVWKASLFFQAHPEVLDRLDYGSPRLQGRNREAFELFLSGVRPYFISKALNAHRQSVYTICKDLMDQAVFLISAREQSGVNTNTND